MPGLVQSLRTLWALKQQADAKVALVGENLSAWDHAVAAYERGASLPGIVRVYGGVTESAVDDHAARAVEDVLGELKQAAFNGAELMRGNAAMLIGLAAQLDGLYAFLDVAEQGSLKKLLEG